MNISADQEDPLWGDFKKYADEFIFHEDLNTPTIPPLKALEELVYEDNPIKDHEEDLQMAWEFVIGEKKKAESTPIKKARIE